MSEVKKSQIEAVEDLQRLAKAQGMTLEEYINGPVKKMLEIAWKIQNETGKPVPIDRIVKEMNKEALP